VPGHFLQIQSLTKRTLLLAGSEATQFDHHRPARSLVAERLANLLFMICLASNTSYSQALTPRAYTITPIHVNAVTLGYSFSDGTVLLDDTVPITDGVARLSTPVFNYFHALSFIGRSANFTAALPYTIGHLQGKVLGAETKVYRSGLGGSAYRFSVNLKGGPSITPKEFLSWRQKTLLGVSLAVVAPTGQYDPARLVNIGTNRWAFKPELGLSRRWRTWLFDAYGGAWFFTTNQDFFPGTVSRSQEPIGVAEMHLSYDVKTGFWASIDSNFWYGGTTSRGGIEDTATLQKNSRIGATCAIPVGKRQTLKFSYSRGAYVRFGGNFQNLSIGWQYSWLGKPN